MSENRFNIFYCRTSINIIYILVIIKKFKFRPKNNILIININKTCVNYGFVKTILNIILPKFNKIFYVNFNNDHIKGNFLQKVIIRSKNIKNVQKLSVFNKLNQFKIKNYYGCGDEFDNAFFNSYNLSDRVKLNFIEHGYGNLINTIIFKPSFKNLIYFAIIKLLYSLNLTSIYPLKYQDFLGVLGKNIKKKLDLYINNSKVNYIFLENVLKEIKLLIIKLNLKYRFKKKSVFLNFSTLEFPKKNNTDLDSLISSTIKKIRKNDFCFYTSHPRNKDQNKSIKYLIKKLKKLKIKLNFIDNKKFNYFPAELIIYFFNTHKIISNLSSIPLNISIIDKSIKNYIFLNYSLKHPNTNHGPAHNKSCKKYYLKYFKKVNYI